MSQKMVQRWCPNDGQVLAVKDTPNHLLHLILSILTGGVWIIVWLIVAAKDKPALCTKCGSTTLVAEPVPKKSLWQRI